MSLSSNSKVLSERALSIASNNNNENKTVSVTVASPRILASGTRLSADFANNSVNQIARDLLQLQNANLSFAQSAHSAHLSASHGASFSASASASASASGSASASFLSEIEQAILRANIPIEINETEEITVNGERGIWANRAEVINWKGIIPITEYLINEDLNPEIITKRTEQKIEYIQELAIRYLRPPTPPAPGEILITQEINSLTPPAPPLIIRQQPPRPDTPEPLVIREAPPQPPAQVGRKVITISGKRIPPAPRKVIIERLAPLPSKPQSVLIERWLPYAEVKRRVIFQKSNEKDPIIVKPRNVIIQWEAPEVQIKKEFKYLGVIKANPVEYVERYGATLKVSADLPQFVLDIPTPEGIVLAADYKYNSLHELYGDVQALKLIDLDKEGLGEYREYLLKLFASSSAAFSASFSASASASASHRSSASLALAASAGASASLSASAALSSASAVASASAAAVQSAIIEEIFKTLDTNHSGTISVEETEKILLRLNSRLGRKYGEDDVKAFFAALDVNNDGSLDFEEFKKAFLSFSN